MFPIWEQQSAALNAQQGWCDFFHRAIALLEPSCRERDP
jgi:hypothetical protein